MNNWIRIALSDCPDQPWANKDGTTRQLLAWPATDLWSLRVSVATISQSGPYSKLPHTRRWQNILQGSVILTIHDHKVHLDRQSDPFAFDGEEPCDCELVQGPAQALNIMTRGSFSAKVSRIRNNAGLVGVKDALPFEACLDKYVLVGVYAQAPTRVEQNGQSIDLEPAQWLWSDTPTPTPEQIGIYSDDAVLVLLEGITK